MARHNTLKCQDWRFLTISPPNPGHWVGKKRKEKKRKEKKRKEKKRKKRKEKKRKEKKRKEKKRKENPRPLGVITGTRQPA